MTELFYSLSGSGAYLNEDLKKFSYRRQKRNGGEFPGGPVIRTQHFHCRGPGLIPGWGTKIPQAVRRGQIKKKKKEMETS